MYTPGEYADLSDLANTLQVAAGLGGFGMGYVRGMTGLAIGAGIFGVGAGAAFWVGWQIGTAIHLGFTAIIILRNTDLPQ